MSDKAVVTIYDADRDKARGDEKTRVDDLNLTIDATLPYGTLVEADEGQQAMLAEQELSVTPLPDLDVLGIGAYRIDTSRDAPPPDVPPELLVPDEQRVDWPHHLVQLIAPPTSEWILAIEDDDDVDVVEPLSRYGLFVVGRPEVVRALPERHKEFVVWTGLFEPAYRISEPLLGLQGRIQYVSVSIFPRAAAAEVEQALPGLGAEKRKSFAQARSPQLGGYASMLVEIDHDRLPDLARLPHVRSLAYAAPEPRLAGEREVQIVAGNLDHNHGPLTGYLPWLDSINLHGDDVCIAICDTGVDANEHIDTDGHPDFGGERFAGFKSYGDAPATDTNGHGTNVASIAVGSAAAGQRESGDPTDFFLGLGVAPKSRFVIQNPLNSSAWPPDPDFMSQLAGDAVQRGAHITNNSWGISGTVGYTDVASRIDWLVRDADDQTEGLQPLVFVAAAGNGGSNGPGSIGAPHEAKNAITVGATFGTRGSFAAADKLVGGSSRGPAHDGRILPTVVAPGARVSVARSATATGSGNYAEVGEDEVTSFAAPHVAGCCALIVQWWRNTHGVSPTPAMVKALLINGAVDIAGGDIGQGCCLGPIPNGDQGWGRVNVKNIVRDAPETDRGPRICIDSAPPFTGDARQQTFRVVPADPTRHMRITLVWTDVPGGIGTDKALVNNLDLEVRQQPHGPSYLGNHFEVGFSVPGGTANQIDNVECVYIEEPAGEYEVRVKAARLAGNARDQSDHTPWQDFALVMDNAEEAP